MIFAETGTYSGETILVSILRGVIYNLEDYVLIIMYYFINSSI